MRDRHIEGWGVGEESEKRSRKKIYIKFIEEINVITTEYLEK